MNKLVSPVSVQLELTGLCNYRCRHCYNFWRCDDDVVVEPDFSKEIVDVLVSNDVFHVVLTGGEPLLRYDTLVKSVESLVSNNVSVSLNSNLSLMTSTRAEELYSLGLRSVLTSLYSCDEKKNNYQMCHDESFGLTLDGIATSSSAGLHVGVNMVVNKDNLSDVYDTGRFVLGLGASRFHATRSVPSGERDLVSCLSREESSVLFESLSRLESEGFSVGSLNPVPSCFGDYGVFSRGRGCSAGLTSMAVGVDGGVRACQHDSVVYGNLLTSNLRSIWNDIPVFRDDFLPSVCRSCSLVSGCGGGCRHYGRVATGVECGVDPLFSGRQDVVVAKKDFSVRPELNVRFANGLRVRDEVSGGVLFRDVAHYAVLNDFAYSLLPLIATKSFNATSLSKDFLAPVNGFQKMIGFLLKKKLLEEV